MSKDITLEVNVDDALVKLGVFACLRVKLEGLSTNSELNGLNRTMNIYDVALLAECNQVVDIVNRTRHDISISLKDNLAGFSIPDLSDFSRIDGILRSLEESETYDAEHEEQDFDDYEEVPDEEEYSDYPDDEFEKDGSEEGEVDEDEGLNRVLETAQKFEVNARMNLSMRDYDLALSNIEQSLEILLPLKEAEEAKFSMLRVLLLKDEVLQEAGSEDDELFQMIKEIVDELGNECTFAKRPLYQQRVIEKANTVLNHGDAR